MNGKYVLQKAQSKDTDFKSPALNMLIALGGLGVFAGIICIFVILLSALSGGRSNDQAFIAAVGITIICAFVFTASYAAFNRKKKAYIKNKKSMLTNAKRFSGHIVGIVKNIRHVEYMHETFDEVTWSFKIEYTDDAGTKTINSDLYLNDITQVLKDDRVSVLVLSDGATAVKNFHLRNETSDPVIDMPVEEVERRDEN